MAEPFRLRAAILAGRVRERVRPCKTPPDERCCMGSTVDPAVWCRRPAPDGLWCDRHDPRKDQP